MTPSGAKQGISDTATMERVNKLRSMPRTQVYKVKIAQEDRFDSGKTVSEWMESVAKNQLHKYAEQLLRSEGMSEVVGHVIASIGSSHCLHKSRRFSLDKEDKLVIEDVPSK